MLVRVFCFFRSILGLPWCAMYLISKRRLKLKSVGWGGDFRTSFASGEVTCLIASKHYPWHRTWLIVQSLGIILASPRPLRHPLDNGRKQLKKKQGATDKQIVIWKITVLGPGTSPIGFAIKFYAFCIISCPRSLIFEICV